MSRKINSRAALDKLARRLEVDIASKRTSAKLRLQLSAELRRVLAQMADLDQPKPPAAPVVNAEPVAAAPAPADSVATPCRQPLAEPLPLEAFLPPDPPAPKTGQVPDPESGSESGQHPDTGDLEEVIVSPAVPARYGPATASVESFTRALRSAVEIRTALGHQQFYFTYRGSTVDGCAIGDLHDLRKKALAQHRRWNVDGVINLLRQEFSSDLTVYAKALLDIAGENNFDQDRLIKDLERKLADVQANAVNAAAAPADVKAILEDALQRARFLQSTDKATKYYSGAKPAALVLDVPGPLLEKAKSEVREKRKRQVVPEPRVMDVRLPHFERILSGVPDLPGQMPGLLPRAAAPALGYYRDSRGVDHPISLALEYYWDLVENFAKDRPKKDETTEALQQLSSRVEAIADAHSSVAASLEWVGRKKGNRTLGGQ